MANTYEYGEVAHLTVQFVADGVPTNPDTVTLYHRPDNQAAPTTYVFGEPGSPIGHDGDGAYHADIPVPQCPSDRLELAVYYQFIGTGAAAGEGESYYLVKASQADPGH